MQCSLSLAETAEKASAAVECGSRPLQDRQVHHGDLLNDWPGVLKKSSPMRNGRRSLVARMADGRDGRDGAFLAAQPQMAVTHLALVPSLSRSPSAPVLTFHSADLAMASCRRHPIRAAHLQMRVLECDEKGAKGKYPRIHLKAGQCPSSFGEWEGLVIHGQPTRGLLGEKKEESHGTEYQEKYLLLKYLYLLGRISYARAGGA